MVTRQSPPAVEGQSAAIRGEPMSACPYSVATPEGRQWHRAWLTAESYRQHQSGEAERRTLEQRAEAHRLAAVWEPARYDVNPVDVLCAEVAAEPDERPANVIRLAGLLGRAGVTVSGVNVASPTVPACMVLVAARAVLQSTDASVLVARRAGVAPVVLSMLAHGVDTAADAPSTAYPDVLVA